MKVNLKSKKGFTLIELIATIVVLGIILAIIIPAIGDVIEKSTMRAFESDAKMVLTGIDYKKLSVTDFDPETITKDNVNELLGISNENYENISIYVENNIPEITIVGKGKWKGLIACGTAKDMLVVKSVSDCNTDMILPVITILGDNPVNMHAGQVYIDAGATAVDDRDGDITDKIVVSGTVNPNVPGTYTITYNVSDKAGNAAVAKTRTVTVLNGDYNLAKGVNSPKLAPGMTPIKWNGTTEVTTTENDPDWYDYSTKKWANAKTADGSYWVWIPRYIYKISSGWHSKTTGTIQVQFSKGTSDNWNSLSIGNIDTGTTANASNNKWTNHPAFTFGDTELTGFWVAKYEATAAEGVDNYDADNVTTKTVKVVSNVQSWRYITTGNAFTAIRKMESNSVYGWPTASGLKEDGTYTTDTNNIDTHLMKNIEWGAVAYLSKSQYGKNTEEIGINASSNYITGTGGDAASTTGNIYGIYDISGGAWERVSAYVDNGHSTLVGQGSSILNAVNKYKDVYLKGSTDNAQNNYNLTINKKGDAVYETSNNIGGSYSWFNDHAYMPTAGGPWFRRGGDWNDGGSAGAFNFNIASGGVGSSNGFRPVLVVNAGL